MSGQGAKDRADVAPDVLSSADSPHGVVIEDHVRGMHGHDHVEVVAVPGLVVGGDRLGERSGGVRPAGSAHQGEEVWAPERADKRDEGADASRTATGRELGRVRGDGGLGRLPWHLARKSLGAEAFGFNVVVIEAGGELQAPQRVREQRRRRSTWCWRARARSVADGGREPAPAGTFVRLPRRGRAHDPQQVGLGRARAADGRARGLGLRGDLLGLMRRFRWEPTGGRENAQAAGSHPGHSTESQLDPLELGGTAPKESLRA